MPCRPSASLFVLLVRQRMADEQRTRLIPRDKMNYFPKEIIFRGAFAVLRPFSAEQEARTATRSACRAQLHLKQVSMTVLMDTCSSVCNLNLSSLVQVWARTRISYGAFTAPRHERRRKCLDKPHSHALRAPWWQDMSGNAMNAEKTVRPARSLAVRMTNERRRQVARATRRIRGEPPILRSRRIGNQHHSHGTRAQTSVDRVSCGTVVFVTAWKTGYGNRDLDTDLRTLVTHMPRSCIHHRIFQRLPCHRVVPTSVNPPRTPGVRSITHM